MAFTKKNTLDIANDIPGSSVKNLNRNLGDEDTGKGLELDGQYGNLASITGFYSGAMILDGLSNMTENSVGNSIKIDGAANTDCNGEFIVLQYLSPTSVSVYNQKGTASDQNNGSLSWKEIRYYNLSDDFDYLRVDRQAIKGTPNYWSQLPTYQTPKAIGVNIDVNLQNLAGKTLDAVGFIAPIIFREEEINSGDTKITLASQGNLPHASVIGNKSGVPLFDTGPFAGRFESCLAKITYQNTENQIKNQDGYTIIGLTKAGTSLSPDTVDVYFYKVKFSEGLSSAVQYTWEQGMDGYFNVEIGYFKTLEDLDETIFRHTNTLSNFSTADLRIDVDDIQKTIGTEDGYSAVDTYLTNKSGNFTFSSSPSTVADALNSINSKIGNMHFTGPILITGYSVTDGLQQLSDAIEVTGWRYRFIETITSEIQAFTPHKLPYDQYYIPDPTFQSANLMVFVNGYLRDPSNYVETDSYKEIDMFHIMFYDNVAAGSRISYIIRRPTIL